MKKRNEEGYVLVYVMVVVFVLCAIALALMSGTLRTLQAQEAMVQRMKDKYEAMGEIELFVAELNSKLDANDFLYSGTNCSNFRDAYDSATNSIEDIISSSDFFDDANVFFSELPSFSSDSSQDYSGLYSYSVVATNDAGTISVSAVIDLSFEFTLENNTRAPTEEEQLAGTVPPPNYTYDILLSSPSFSLYEIASHSSEEGGND